MRRAALVVLFALLSLQPLPGASASSDDSVSVTRYPPRRPPAEAQPDDSGTTTEVLPHRTGRARDPGASSESASPVQRTAINASAPSVGVNAHGFSSTGVVPPDPAGEVGTTQFVHTVNTRGGSIVGVFDKTTGANVKTFHMDSIAPFGNPCRHGLGDGVPLWDQLDARWILTEIASRQNSLCVYVSSGPDAATSSYTLYKIAFKSFPDYPKWAIWPNAIYLGLNHGSRTNPIFALNKAKMIAGAPLLATDVVKPSLQPFGMRGFGFQILAPVDLDGATPPPPTTPGIFVRHVDDEVNRRRGNRGHTKDFIEYFELSPDFGTGTATLAGPFGVAVASFDSRLCGLVVFACVPQRGTRVRLDPLREPMMQRPLMRVIGSAQTLVGSFTVDIGHDHAGVRWFELTRPAATTSGGWTLADEGTYDPVGRQRWVPSIAVNDAGDIALGYSASSGKSFPSIRVTGRHAGDPSGVMTQDETVLQGSTGPQTFASRWGDYTEMSVDPVDDTTFWYTNEYLNHRGDWRTRIASFTLGP